MMWFDWVDAAFGFGLVSLAVLIWAVVSWFLQAWKEVPR